MFTQMRIGVTGAGGFIASHLIERLLNEGAKVRAFIRYTSRGDEGNVRYIPETLWKDLEIISGNLLDSSAVDNFVKGVDILFHLGSLIAIPYSYVHPREVIETNVIGTLNVIEASRNHGIENIIHTSTSEVYGTAQYTPIDEHHPLQGQSPYSASKIGADKVAESYYSSFGIPVKVVRPFNTFGPRQSARAVIPTIITQVLGGDEVLLGDITPTRDFTYVDDTVEGFLKIAESDEAIGKVVNIGSGKEISIGDLAIKIGDIIGNEIKISSDDMRLRPTKSEVRRLLADISLAKSLLGWKPKISLTEGLKLTIDWIEVNLSKFKIGEYKV